MSGIHGRPLGLACCNPRLAAESDVAVVATVRARLVGVRDRGTVLPAAAAPAAAAGAPNELDLAPGGVCVAAPACARTTRERGMVGGRGINAATRRSQFVRLCHALSRQFLQIFHFHQSELSRGQIDHLCHKGAGGRRIVFRNEVSEESTRQCEGGRGRVITLAQHHITKRRSMHTCARCLVLLRREGRLMVLEWSVLHSTDGRER